MRHFKTMQYLITTNDGENPFLTNWFDSENHFNSQIGMVVYDLYNQKYTNNGTQWEHIVKDHL